MAETALAKLEALLAPLEGRGRAVSQVGIPLGLARQLIVEARAAASYAEIARLTAKGAPPGGVDLGTAHLPETVVAQEVSAWVLMSTSDGSSRRGTLGLGLRLGGRDNPELTQDEAEYVARTLEAAAAKVRASCLQVPE